MKVCSIYTTPSFKTVILSKDRSKSPLFLFSDKTEEALTKILFSNVYSVTKNNKKGMATQTFIYFSCKVAHFFIYRDRKHKSIMTLLQLIFFTLRQIARA